MSTKRLLLVEDDRPLAELITFHFERAGFAVTRTGDGEEALILADEINPDLVLLDWMIEGISGIEVCRRLRRKPATANLPIVMLTARGDDVDRIVGLEIGADDYLPKPFNPRELVARINAVLRRARPDDSIEKQTRETLVVGDIEIDDRTRTVRRAGEAVELTAVEYDLLKRLLQMPGHVLTKEELVKDVLHRNLSPFDRSIDMHISNLRKKLGHHVRGVERIKTVRGVGYIYTQAAETESERQIDA
jgi:DNA-binding response OmpR family regulator